VEVSLTVSGDQTTAQFVAATPAAREVLEQALPRLRDVLAEAGIQLADSGVSTSDQGAAGRHGNGRSPRSQEGGGSPTGDVTSVVSPWMRRGEGLVDTFA
jgi:flagellar hook-length control protein FliK